MEKMSVSMDVGSDGVAVISFYNPPLNALSPPLIAALKEKYAEAMKSDAVKAIVLTGKAGVYSSGFDVNALQNAQMTGDMSWIPDASVELLVNNIEVPVLQACHARIAAPEVQLGLPELRLGITPGFGGTQRLPRLVGIPKAIEMMLSSKSITSKEGNNLGLVDAIMSSEELLTASRCWALDISDRRKARISSLRRTDKLCSLAEAHEILMLARQCARQIIPNLPHHLECLEVVGEGIFFGGYAGILKEAEIFTKLSLSSTSRDLVCAFFTQCANAQMSSERGKNKIPWKPRSAVVSLNGSKSLQLDDPHSGCCLHRKISWKSASRTSHSIQNSTRSMPMLTQFN